MSGLLFGQSGADGRQSQTASDSRYRNDVAMFASGSAGSSCSTMYHSTPAASRRLDDRGERQGPLPGRRVVRRRPGRAVLHVEQPDAVRDGPDLGHRDRGRRPTPNRRRARARPRAGAPRGGCPRSSSRRAARTRSRGCDSRARMPSSAIRRANPPSSAAKRTDVVGVARSASGIHGTITRGQPSSARRPATAPASARRRSMPSCEATACRPLSSSSRLELGRGGLGQAGQLDGPIAGRRDGAQRPRQIVRREAAERVELERDLVVSHPGTIGHRHGRRAAARRRVVTGTRRAHAGPCGCRSLSAMTPLGIGIVGTGNIAGGYAKDALTHPEIRLVAATDLDPDRAAAFAATHGCRAHASLDDLLADDEVDIVINLTVHHAHYEVTKRALEAGRHVYSEKPLALRSSEARELVDARRVARAAPRLLARRPSSARRSRRRPRSSGAGGSEPSGRSMPRSTGAASRRGTRRRPRSTTSASWSTSGSTR